MGNNFSNPVYIMPALILVGVILYFLYGAVDSAGLETRTATATVTAKTHTPGSTSYVNRIAAGRSWTQAQQQPDFYALSLMVDGEPTVALVTKERFDEIRENDMLSVVVRRTRISGKLEVIEVK
jgi:hypothetical protein